MTAFFPRKTDRIYANFSFQSLTTCHFLATIPLPFSQVFGFVHNIIHSPYLFLITKYNASCHSSVLFFKLNYPTTLSLFLQMQKILMRKLSPFDTSQGNL